MIPMAKLILAQLQITSTIIKIADKNKTIDPPKILFKLTPLEFNWDTCALWLAFAVTEAGNALGLVM